MKSAGHIAKLLLLAAIATNPNISQAVQAGSSWNWRDAMSNLKWPRASDVPRLGSYLWSTAQEYPKTALSLGVLGGMGGTAYYYRKYLQDAYKEYIQGALNAVKKLLSSESYVEVFLLDQKGYFLTNDIRLMNKIRGYSSALSRIAYLSPGLVPESASLLYIEPTQFLQSNRAPAWLLLPENTTEEFKIPLIMTIADRLATNDKSFAQKFLITLYNAVKKLPPNEINSYKKTIQEKIQKDNYSALDEALGDPVELVKQALSSSSFIAKYLLGGKYIPTDKELFMKIKLNLFYLPFNSELALNLYSQKKIKVDVAMNHFTLIERFVSIGRASKKRYGIGILSKIAEEIAKDDEKFAMNFITALYKALDTRLELDLEPTRNKKEYINKISQTIKEEEYPVLYNALNRYGKRKKAD